MQTLKQLHGNNGCGELGDILISMLDDLLTMEISCVHSVWDTFLRRASKQVHMHQTSK
jgi:hypothetical protein